MTINDAKQMTCEAYNDARSAYDRAKLEITAQGKKPLSSIS